MPGDRRGEHPEQGDDQRQPALEAVRVAQPDDRAPSTAAAQPAVSSSPRPAASLVAPVDSSRAVQGVERPAERVGGPERDGQQHQRDPAAGHRDQRPVQRRTAPAPGCGRPARQRAAGRGRNTREQGQPDAGHPGHVHPGPGDRRADLHRQRRHRPRLGAGEQAGGGRRADREPDPERRTPAVGAGGDCTVGRLIGGLSPGPGAVRRPRRCRSAPPRRRSTARPACRRRRRCWPRPARAPARAGPGSRSPVRPGAELGAAVGGGGRRTGSGQGERDRRR